MAVGCPQSLNWGQNARVFKCHPQSWVAQNKKHSFFVCVFEPLLEKRSATQLVFPKGEMLNNYRFDLGSFGIFLGIQKNKAFFFLSGQKADISVLYIKKTHVKIQPWPPVKVHHRVSTPSFHIRSGGRQGTTRCSRI